MFNILSSIHRSIDASHRRESECEDLWQPRMEGVAGYIADTFVSLSVAMLSACSAFVSLEFLAMNLTHT
jgi:hypothetical protein